MRRGNELMIYEMILRFQMEYRISDLSVLHNKIYLLVDFEENVEVANVEMCPRWRLI